MSIKDASPFATRFVFHANAVASDVFLTKVHGVEQTIYHPIDGQSSLGSIGGKSRNEVFAPKFDKPLADVFFYGASVTSAEGVFEGQTPVTTAHARVEDLRITNREKAHSPDVVFRAAVLSQTVVSKYSPDPGQSRFDCPEIPIFKGLSLDGSPIELTLNEELLGCARWCDVEHRYKHDEAFFKSCPFVPGETNRPPKFGDDIPRRPGSYAATSFVRGIRVGDRTIEGHVLPVPGFGLIYFGEILLSEGERRVTMVRTKLGCQSAGQSVNSETDPNGSTTGPGSGGGGGKSSS